MGSCPGEERGALPRAARALLRTAAAGLLIATVVGIRMATADEPEILAHLEYRAAPACPGEDAFVALVHARMPRVRFVERGERDEKGRAFLVEAAIAGTQTSSHRAGASGTLTVMVRRPFGGTRRIEAKTCADVTNALALMLVLAIDPRSLVAAPTSASVASSSAGAQAPVDARDAGDSGPGSTDGAARTERDASAGIDASRAETIDGPADGVADAALVDAVAPPPAAVAPDTLSPVPEGPPVAAPASSRPGRFFVGADFVVATGVTPVTLFTGSPVVGWRTTGAALLGASVRAGFLRVGTGTLTTTPGRSADYTWTVGRADACALLWPARALRLGACARVEVGALDVSGKEVNLPRTVHSPWVAAGVLGRGEWSFFGPLSLGLDVGPAFHITANEFYFLSSTDVYTVPVVGIWAEAGVGAYFF